MKLNAEKLFLAGSAVLSVVLISTAASATKSVEITNVSNNLNKATTYTASGTMDKKMAVMITNLLRNPHLQVRAEINGRALQIINPKPALKNPMNILANYTITGKTNRKTVLRLKKLLQNNKYLQINAEATFNTKRQRVANVPAFKNHSQLIAAYTPFYSNVMPPLYIQGNRVWMPVLINQPMVIAPVVVSPELIAKN